MDINCNLSALWKHKSKGGNYGSWTHFSGKCVLYLKKSEVYMDAQNRIQGLKHCHGQTAQLSPSQADHTILDRLNNNLTWDIEISIFSCQTVREMKNHSTTRLTCLLFAIVCVRIIEVVHTRVDIVVGHHNSHLISLVIPLFITTHLL